MAERAVARRTVAAVAGATGVVTFSFWALLIGLAAGAQGEALGAAVALAVAAVPFAFVAAAFGSLHDRAGGAVVYAMVLAVGAGAVLLVLDPGTALIGAYAAGAIVTVRETPQTSMSRRTVFALSATVIAALLIRFLTPVGFALAPALPFTAVALADHTNA
jgi:hypothetical protein